MYYENPQGVAVHDGFPNPATDASLQTLNLNQLLIKNGASTYFMRLDSNDWQSIGLYAYDILIIDRAISPHPNDIAVWTFNGELVLSFKNKIPEGAEVWGTVTTTIHRLREAT